MAKEEQRGKCFNYYTCNSERFPKPCVGAIVDLTCKWFILEKPVFEIYWGLMILLIDTSFCIFTFTLIFIHIHALSANPGKEHAHQYCDLKKWPSNACYWTLGPVVLPWTSESVSITSTPADSNANVQRKYRQ